jgi:predicted phage-related endonuclease
MKWGTLIEPVVYQEYEANHLRRGQIMTTGATFAHIDRPWQIANPDGLIWDENRNLVDGIEIKVPGTDHTETWGRDGSDKVPIYYRCQIAWYCSVLGLKSMVLRALIGGNDPRSYRIKPTQADMDLLVREGEQFIHDLDNDVLPNLDSHTATYQALRQLHPDIDRGTIVQVDAEFSARWWAAQDALETAQNDWNQLRSELADKMGTGWSARCGDEKVAYRVRPAKEGGDPYIKSANRPKVTETSITEAAAA